MAMVRYMAWACWGLGGLALAGAVIEADPALIAPAAAGAVVGVLLMALDRLLAILDGARAALERMAGGETAAEGGGSSQGAPCPPADAVDRGARRRDRPA